MQPHRILFFLALVLTSLLFNLVDSMQVVSRDALCQKTCGPCAHKGEGKESLVMPAETAKAQLAELKEGWYLTHDGQRIRKDWKVRNFKVGMKFLQQVGDIAEEEGHHPGAYGFWELLERSILHY